MLRAFSTLGCPDLSLEEVLALAARHRIDAVELRALGGTAELPEYFAARYGSPSALAEKMHGAPVRVIGLSTSFRVIDHAPADRERLLEFVPWAEALGAPWLRVFDGGRHAEREDLSRGHETLGWWNELRRERGWRVQWMIETHDALTATKPLVNFMNGAPAGPAILWDTHHTWRKGGEDLVATWQAIKPWVCHVHVKDSIAVPSARHPFTYVLPGKGEFPIGALLKRLNAEEFRGHVSLEWERMWHPYLPSLDEALSHAATQAWW